MTIDGVTIQSKSERWVILQLYKGCVIVLPRQQFTQAIRRGKWWKWAEAMRARQAALNTMSDAHSTQEQACSRP